MGDTPSPRVSKPEGQRGFMSHQSAAFMGSYDANRQRRHSKRYQSEQSLYFGGWRQLGFGSGMGQTFPGSTLSGSPL
jgi:hypothetical protein